MSDNPSANTFRGRLSLRRPKSASRVTERQHWGMDGNQLGSLRAGNSIVILMKSSYT